MNNNFITAGFIIIGDEILSGRTVDQNLNFLAKNLSEIGIILKEVRVVGDIEAEIISTINELRNKYNYIFTSGGIGPTHDDITSMSVAKAFNQPLILNDIAKKILIHHYGENNVNEARMKMAYLPKNASLLDNPVSSAPGFVIENVFVMAGVPKIFQAMFKASINFLKTGEKILSRELKISLTESIIAKDLSNLQLQFPDISMGSYPFEGGTSLVFRGVNSSKLSQALELMIFCINKINKNEKIEIL
ncbi:MAG: competence/damage-inducible protein A [Proteobacteria bacterium]|nr:competence/damage-inducible protein A [Pseudomonadota bacterium]NCA28895.1 competence/damage-inducible protein A [Pseudomonadota bacterium]